MSSTTPATSSTASGAVTTRPTTSIPAPSSRSPLSDDDKKSCQSLLSDCEMFHKLNTSQLQTLVSGMKGLQLEQNQILVKQGQLTRAFYLLQNGDIRREFLDPDTGKHHTVEFLIKAKSINSMRVLSGDPVHSTVKCTSYDGCKLFEMPRQELLKIMHQKPEIGIQIASALSEEVRVASKKYATPLLEQRQQEINVPFVAIASGIESYYRSALNAQINRALTGVSAEMFPNMHIQVPVRIAYITGFKGLRSLMDKAIDSQEHTDKGKHNQFGLRFLMAIAPGIIMTPISSILEASNAGHLNNESMQTRWMRGIVARCGREIVFGLGLNQLSDYWEERWQEILGRETASPVITNAAGSLTAGVISGYFSHVPHNLSTYKLLEPHRSYRDLYSMFVKRSIPTVVEKYIQRHPTLSNSPTLAQIVRYTTATIFPKGLLVRTTQIVGSFMILNGTINFLQLREYNKIQKMVTVPLPSLFSNDDEEDNDDVGVDNDHNSSKFVGTNKQSNKKDETLTVAGTARAPKTTIQRIFSRPD